MMRLALMGYLLAVWAAATAAPESHEAALRYSGDDIAGGPGTLTIRCVQSDRGLWELDLVRAEKKEDVTVTRFDDLTDKGDFNYAPGPGNSYSLFMTHQATHIKGRPFTELHKGEDYYEYSLTEVYGAVVVITTYRVSAASADGTTIVARRTLANTSGRKLVPVPSGIMQVWVSLGVGPYDGRRKGAGCTLSKRDKSGRRQHKLKNGQGAIWTVTGNCSPRDNRAFDRKKPMWCEATVGNSKAARDLGLARGRSFRLDTDLIGYYPASSVGRVWLDNRATYMDGLRMEITPREWFGTGRDDHNKRGIAQDAIATKMFTFRINIKAK